ncbi:MAG: polysaccharide deacetylase family protein [Conexibacter sp.]|nr:polysaccharide deacetylase family protein [Conexibacter sp.]
MRAASIAAAAALSAGAAWSLPALAPLVPSLCRSLRVPRVLAGDEPVVALTFDDGPHPQGTPAVLDALAAANAAATFFLVGEQVRRWPQLAAAIVAAGHTVALHGDRHRCLLRVPPAQLARDLDRGHQEIVAASGVEPTLYRAPYGIFSHAALAIARERGWTPLMWSGWGRDWARRATPAGIAAKVTERLAPRDVLLLHDADHYSAPESWRRTAAALPLVLDEIARRGLRSVAL